jgi:serine/threonine protein kinase/Flp pilus assembly protein TadD
MSWANRGDSAEPSRHSVESTRTFVHASRVPDLSFEMAHAEVLQEMASDRESGGGTPAEEWLRRYPHLAEHAETAVRIVYEEVCLREEQGETVDAAEIQQRFPRWADALRMLLDCHQLIQGEQPTPSFPLQGQQLGELQLVRKLGSGALGQVFLATQSSLSDRPLVVKLTPRTGDEHLSLARLQHTHIVPLYHVLDLPEQNLRALCMPYVGGQSWSALLAALQAVPPAQRSGAKLAEALADSPETTPGTPQRTGPALAFLSRASYVQSVCWIGACLADALHYAHQCGLVHMDIKPSNVLIAGDGQPMLLDFHLARPALSAGSDPPSRLGGTHGYMSPEQELATAAVREGRAVPKSVNGRSDIYSLGVTLYESLVGRAPGADEATQRRNWRHSTIASSRGLEDIVHKCLAANAPDRYHDAGQLAADLRRHLADLPLQGVPNHSLPERWRKWRRRKPHALAGVAAALAVVGIAAVFLVAYVSDRLGNAKAALAQAEQSLAKNEFATAADQLEDGWRAIRWLPGQSELKQSMQTQLAAARHGRLAQVVHRLTEELRFLDSYQTVSRAQLQQLDQGCEKLWAVRQRVLPTSNVASLAEENDVLRTDLTDLAIAWAALRVRLSADGRQPAKRREALDLLDQAESLCGSSFALVLAKREYQSPSLSPHSAAELDDLPEPQSARDHYALGRFLFKNGQLPDAVREFDRAIDVEPDTFWPYFYRSIAAYRLREFERALDSANVCIALVPASAPCFYNRAQCYQALGNSELALRDFNRAIELEPKLAVAWLERGKLQAEQADFAAAKADLQQALALGASRADANYQLARVAIIKGDRDVARRHLALALESDAGFAPAAALEKELDAVSR